MQIEFQIFLVNLVSDLERADEYTKLLKGDSILLNDSGQEKK